MPTTTAPRTGDAALLHLLRRTTSGPTRHDLDVVRAGGWRAWVDAQLAPAALPDPVGDDLVARFPRLGWTVAQARSGLSNGSWDLMFDLAVSTLARRTWSSRQLLEALVELWSDHLNVTCPSSDVWDSRHDYDRTVIRANALGRFGDLLVASARHRSMLAYLDGATSTRTAPNENYGRELLELHTVGAAGGWTEADVRAAARLMTGWTMSYSTGATPFVASRHDPGAVTVLGRTVPARDPSTGPAAQEQLLRWLAVHPATAAALCRKLCVRFVADDPPAALVQRLATTWTSTGGDVRAVMAELLSSEEFWASGGQKVRRPAEDLTATLRVLEVQPDATGTKGLVDAYWTLVGTGHRPLAAPSPKGYPDVVGAWQSAGAALAAWNGHVNLVAAWYPKALRIPPRTALLPTPLPTTYGGLVDAVSTRLLLGRLPQGQRAALLAFMGVAETSALRPTDVWVTTRVHKLAALVLDSPSFRNR